MFRRKLTALDYHNPAGFNCKGEAPAGPPRGQGPRCRRALRRRTRAGLPPRTLRGRLPGAADETEFRNFIVWLEDQKIRHYKIEDRGNLRNIHSSDWPKFFEKYLTDVSCPFKIQYRQEAIDWLLGLAVRLEYGDNASPSILISMAIKNCKNRLFGEKGSTEKYKDSVSDNTKNADNAAKNAEPLINLDVNNPDFKAGVMALANLLQIQRHDDYLVMLKAIRILVQERLTQDAVAKANQAKEGLPVALDKHILGFDTGEIDAVLNEAAQILRLLHIEELRELQTKINEAIVAVQAIIADPKTDHRLGKVGR
uniref:RNA transcription, translation and transport factor protein n=1 Tax=Myotis lucifugus TaxID=59463 RepID=G1PYP4_MYOLU